MNAVSNNNRPEREFLGVWISHDLAQKLDRTIEEMDLDRSKFMRHAINEKLARVKPEEAAAIGA